MKANYANATFLSSVYEQEAGETNWNRYQTVMTGGATPLTLRTNASTSTNLVVLDDTTPLTVGSTLYLSTDSGTTIKTATIGSITTGNLNIANTALSTTGASVMASSTYGSASYAYGNPGKLNYDGTKLWAMNSSCTSLVEYTWTVGNAATLTTTGKSIGGWAGQGFDFSSDGRYIFRMNTAIAYTIERLTMSTPWDISTVIPALTIQKTLTSSNPNSTNVRSLRISADGTKIVLINQMASTGVYGYTLTVPWDLDSITSNTYTWTTAITGGSLEISPDGKTWYTSSYGDTYVTNIYISVAATAWDARTLGTAVLFTTPSDTTYTQYQVNGNYFNTAVVSGNGKTMLVLPNNYSSAIQRIVYLNIGTGKDLAVSKNIDISGFNLSAAPTNAWLKPPTVAVAATTSASKIIKTTKYLDMSTSTTTTATVNSPETGLISVGDTVLLNGTTAVTVTAVTETANGSASQSAALASDYIKWYSKTFNAGVTPRDITVSNDGFYMYIVGTSATLTGTTVFQYALSTAYDVTTASLINTFKLYNNTLFYNSGYGNGIVGFDIAPDGSSFIVATRGTSDACSIRQYRMLKKHNLDTSTYSAELNLGALGSTGTISRIKFNLTGTQLEYVSNYGNNNQFAGYINLSTAYDISTAGALTALTGSNAFYFGYNGGCWAADGLTYYVLNAYNTGASLNINGPVGTIAHNLNSIAFTTISTSAATASTFPAGSLTTTGLAFSVANSMFMTHNGLFWYIITSTGTVYQFGVRTKAMTKYDITFATQASAPTSVYLPATTYATQTFTPSYSSGNLVFTGSQTTTDARAIQFKLTNNSLNSDVTQIRINLEKT